MKKVVYSVTKYVGDKFTKLSGIGCITDEDLVIACMSKTNKPYIRVFDGCVKQCSEIPGKKGEFKGNIYEIQTIEYETKYGSIDAREIDVSYSIWYKLLD